MKQTKKVLSVVLALAMVLAMSVMTFAADDVATIEPVVKGSTVTVTVKAPASGLPGTFDYGVSFDPEKVTYESTAYDAALSANSDAAGGPLYLVLMAKDQENFVAVTGVSAIDETGIAGGAKVATVTFKVKDGVDTSDLYFGVTAGSMEATEPIKTPAAGDDGVVPAEVVADETDAPATETPATEETPATDAADDKNAADDGAAAATATPAASATAATTTTTTTTAKKTADTASVVVPVVAIVAAAAAVVAVSKKKVEE